MLLIFLTLAARAAAPDAPTLLSPADGAEDVGLSPELSVAVSDPDGDLLSVRFYGRARATPGEDFTLIALPDTQFYACGCSGGSTETFGLQTRWVVDQISALNIAYVAQLGDCVENGDDEPEEWAVADEAFSYFEEDRSPYALPAGGLPYGIAVGNHDQSPMGDPTGTTTYYNLTFGADRFADAAWYGGHFGDDNDNHYDLFEAGGTAFIVLYFEYDTAPDAEVLSWADALLSTHADRHAIVVSHYLLKSDGNFSSQGQSLYDALSTHDNLFLMLAGHVSTEARREDAGLRTVHTLLSDYQSRSGGGDGWLRVMRFSPTAGSIEVSTYSPTLDSAEDDAESAFSLSWDPNPAPWQELGVVEAVGGVATLSWAELAPGSAYEWKVALSDGVDAVEGEVWGFRTAEAGGSDSGGAEGSGADSGGGHSGGADSGGADSGAQGQDSGSTDSGPDGGPDSGPDSAPGPALEDPVSKGGCGCASARGGPGALVLALTLLGLRRRRRA